MTKEQLREEVCKQVTVLAGEAQRRLGPYTRKAKRIARNIRARYRRSPTVEQVHKLLKQYFKAKRKYIKREHNILCECSWNPECNPSIRKFWKFMTEQLKWKADGHLR